MTELDTSSNVTQLYNRRGNDARILALEEKVNELSSAVHCLQSEFNKVNLKLDGLHSEMQKLHKLNLRIMMYSVCAIITVQIVTKLF
jgi:outer membrane murein-binding lipoprotein Lpp